MGQSVYAGSEMTLPSPHPQTGLSGQYLLELEVQGATPSAPRQCADQQAEEDDEARMENKAETPVLWPPHAKS